MVVGIAVREDRRGTIPVTATMDRSAEKRRYGRIGNQPDAGPAVARPWDNRSVTGAKDAPGGCSCWAAAPSAWRWPRRSTGLGVGRSWSWKARTGCSREEPFAGEELRAAFEAEGIAVVTGGRMTAARRLGRDGPVVASLADGREFTGDEILVAVGRRPATADLGLEHVGLEPGRPVGVDQAPRAVGVPGGWLYRDRRLHRARSFRDDCGRAHWFGYRAGMPTCLPS